MANLDKTGIATGGTITAAQITALYDALTGTTKYNNTPSNVGCKVYRAMMTQTGTAAPVESQLMENSLSDAVVWTRSQEGLFFCTLTGEFLTNKTFVLSMSTFIGVITYAARGNDNLISVGCRNSADGIAADCETFTIEIIVYP